MKITSVECLILDRVNPFVRVYTDEGITGIGECFRRQPQVIKTLIEYTLGPVLVGQDPLDNELRWRDMYRAGSASDMGGAIYCAIAGLDIALWDIKGKALGMPIHKLLGGKLKDKIRMYASSLRRDMSPSEEARRAASFVEQGYTAYKLHSAVPGEMDDPADQTIETVRAVRAAVVDDIEMGITHVIRGEDHLSNTSKHVELFKAFGAKLPKFAHIPLILNNDGSKMSKRDSGASMAAYTEGGYLPSAVVNYLSLLGWSPKDNTEMMPTAELIERFDLPGVQRANARFDMPKLDWLNFEHIRALSPDEFKIQALGQLQAAGLDPASRDADFTDAALALCTDKIKNLNDVAGYIGFFFRDDVALDAEAAAQALTPENKPHLATLREAYAGLAKRAH